MGVKSLWSLLDPVGRPVLLETMEGKSMAIDSSIWIYQFQATMRDKEGRGLVNAHVLGFLRRICKLLFYGIKPVFVFDGGAPALKRATIAERKKKKSGAALSHAKLAERLLAAQMRREAINHVHAPSSKGKGKAPSGPVVIDQNTVYLEDIDANAPKTPARKQQQENADPSPPSSKKKRWHDHDPYKLPEVNLEDAIAKATSAQAPDPRLATEDELRAFIEEMRPEDLDVSAPAFRELPTEVQYEIIGDLRLKSRQTSYKRLQNMLRHAPTPLDFSKEQIKNLKQRNALTQQLLTTTDSIGKAQITIPIRVASERNREYVLVKNEGEAGGWVLGIRDDGTQTKPIEIDRSSDHEKGGEEDSDADMEEVPITSHAPHDTDLREFRRGEALAALSRRHSPKKLAPSRLRVHKKTKAQPLFDLDDDERLPEVEDAEDDPELALALQESLEHAEESDLRQALEASRVRRVGSPIASTSNIGASTSGSTLSGARHSTPERRRSSHAGLRTFGFSDGEDDDDDDLYASPTRLETALSIAGAGPPRRPLSRVVSQSQSHLPFPSTQTLVSSPPQSPAFGTPTLLLAHHTSPRLQPPEPSPQGQSPTGLLPAAMASDSDADMEEVVVHQTPEVLPSVAGARISQPLAPQPALPTAVAIDGDSDDNDMEEIVSSAPATARIASPALQVLAGERRSHVTFEDAAASLSPPVSIPSAVLPPLAGGVVTHVELPATPPRKPSPLPIDDDESELEYLDDAPTVSQDQPKASTAARQPPSRSPSPANEHSHDEGAAAEHDDWDAAQEMDVAAEEGEFARFISQVKGKDIDAVRREIDDEIRGLDQQRKAALRDAEDVTQQMVSQIMVMLRLFGIPYITAPMEAEAQCAGLLALGLVDGIITDDSDVFLFGGARVLRNMFNQSKTVECFLLPDLERELGLDRDKLVRLAYLLGSDYTDGLPGVGPVVAMELLTEFPGADGLHKFKDWWQKVQSGKDKAEDTQTSFRKRFKKRFKELFLPDDWPNPTVRDAYYHPTLDESEEPFKWGLPDLDALRNFFDAELGWQQSKVDELLLPIIRKMGKRGQASAMKGQGNLASFLDLPAGSGSHAPRKRQAYASKRLQQVVSDFRKEQARLRAGSASPSASEENAGSGSDDEFAERPAKKRKTASARGKAKGKGNGGSKAADDTGAKKTATGRSARTASASARGAKAKRQTRKRKKAATPSDEDDDEQEEDAAHVPLPSGSPPPRAEGLRPRPKPRVKGKVASAAADQPAAENNT